MIDIKTRKLAEQLCLIAANNHDFVMDYIAIGKVMGPTRRLWGAIDLANAAWNEASREYDLAITPGNFDEWTAVELRAAELIRGGYTPVSAP